jgi:hypothetical protein
MSTWSETDALYAAKKGPTLADLLLRRPEVARELGVKQTAEAPQVEDVEAAAAPVLTLVPAQADTDVEDVDDCTSGSCLHARPGTVCRCTTCFGRDHGAKSTLAPAACGGIRVLRDIVGPGDIRWAACPGSAAGCPDCTQVEKDQAARHAEPVTAAAGAQAFAQLAVGGGLYVEDEPW